MASGHIDTTIKTAVQANTVFDAVLDATAILNWRNELAAKIDGNYDLLTSVTQQAIINGNFAVNQRVVSGTVTLAAGAYGHDRWKAGAAGCTYTFATVNNVTTITITAGSLIQVIEGVNLFSGTYTLSWIGTAQGKIGVGAFGTSGITGAATGGTNLSIEFNTGTLSKVQFNVGNQALPFQPRTFPQEKRDCLRYDYRIKGVASFGIIGVGLVVSSTTANIFVPFPEEMRVAPTLTTSGNLSLTSASGLNLPVTAISIDTNQTKLNGIVLNITVASGLVAGNSTKLQANADATAYLNFDAEL